MTDCWLDWTMLSPAGLAEIALLTLAIVLAATAVRVMSTIKVDDNLW